MTTSTRPPAATRYYPTRELQAAAAALAAGRFSDAAARAQALAEPREQYFDKPSAAGATRPAEDAPDHGVPTDVVGGTVQPTAGTAIMGLEPLVRVRAANAGAGASTITLALADAADAAGVPTRVLDAAAPAWSGLLAATVTELGAADGWRRGRRGSSVLIDRVENRIQVPAAVPAPRPTHGIDLTVLDAGWSMRELTAADRLEAGPWLAATPARVEVIVTRSHGLALSQTEAALAGLEKQLAAHQVVVVVVGANRWSDRAFATAGRRLQEAHEQEAVLFAPLLGPKALPGLGPDPLPKQLTTSAQRLLERITTITGPLTSRT
jgi:hypothetical protein